MLQIEIEDRLQELMRQEASILRDILTNLSHEQQALANQDVERLHFIIEERLQILEAYEKYDAQLIESTHELACLEHKTLPELETLPQDEILVILQEMISEDNLELLSRIDQLRAIHQEIQNKIDLTEFFVGIERKPMAQPAPKKSKKIGLELLEPERL